MWISRFAYLEILAFAIIFYFVYPLWFAWYLLVVVLLILPFDFLISLPGMLTSRVIVEVPTMLEVGEAGELVISSVTDRPFPVSQLRLRLSIMAEQDSRKVRVRVICRDGGRVALAIDSSHSDVIHFTSKWVWVSSLIGLVSWPKKAVIETVVVVLPAAIKHPQSVSILAAINLVPKPGGGFSEETDLRPYRPGDPLNLIHWKLSAKHDELIMREVLAPFKQSRLIEVTQWQNPYQREQLLGRLRWSSFYLLTKRLPHHVRVGNLGEPVLVEDTMQLKALLRLSMLEEQLPASRTAPKHFSWMLTIDATGDADVTAGVDVDVAAGVGVEVQA